MKISIINPITYPNWNDLVLSHSNYSFFHSSNWAKVLVESYDYSPRYFTVMEGDKLSCLFPIMEVKSFLTGQRGVSLPFSDYCEPIIPDGKIFENVFESIIDMGRKCGWKYIEVRAGDNFFKDEIYYNDCYMHTLNLRRTEKQILTSFKGNTRRNINKAIREGVKVRIDNTLDALRIFCRLNCMTRKMHGLPPQPIKFFRKIYEYIIKKGLGNLFVASYNGKVIAGAIYFNFGKKGIFKYAAFDRKYQHLRPNNLCMWEAIKWHINNGYDELNFGKTEPEHLGLRQYKIGWGVDEKIIKNYKYDYDQKCFINGGRDLSEMSAKFFQKLPTPISGVIGNMCYKHMG